MTQEMLSTGTTRDIADYIERCLFPTDAFLLVERLPQQVVGDDERQGLLCFARLGDGIKVAPYSSGRVFSRAFELRWEQDAGATRVVYLGEARDLPTLDDRRQGTFEQVDERRYYLFGARLEPADLATMGITPDERDAPYYAEVRIPRLLRYPVAAQARRAQVVVGEYRSQEHGQVFRFLDVLPANEAGGQT